MESDNHLLKIKRLSGILLLLLGSFYGRCQINLDWVHSFGSATLSGAECEFWRTASDRSGNVYMTGMFSTYTDMDPSPSGQTILSSSGLEDFFLSKFSSDGNLIWARQFHSTAGNTSFGCSIAVDSNSNVFVCGIYEADVIVDAGNNSTTTLTAVSGWNGFFAKYNGDGILVWIKTLVGPQTNADNLVLGKSGNIYLCGTYDGTYTGVLDLDPGPGYFPVTCNNINDYAFTFLAKYSTDGQFIWGKSFNGDTYYGNNDWSMTIDSKENITLTGHFNFRMSFPFDPGVPDLCSYYTDPSLPSQTDTYLIQYDSAGHFRWDRNFLSYPANYGVWPNIIAADNDNNLVLCGGYNISMIDLNPWGNHAVFNNTSSYGEGWLAKYDSLGNYLWGDVFHGNLQNLVENIAINPQNEIYAFGSCTGHCDLDPSPAVHTFQAIALDGYIAKYTSGGGFLYAGGLGHVSGDIETHNIMYSTDGHIYISGEFDGPMNFAPSGTPVILYAPGEPNPKNFGYLAKYTDQPCASTAIKGKVFYYNNDSTPLHSCLVYMKTPSGTVVDSIGTDADGHFIFGCSNSYSPGTYKLSVKCSLPWGGVNSTDALLILKHFVGMINLTGLKKLAADVNASNTINSSDAMLVEERFLWYFYLFPAGDWLFEEKQITIIGQPLPQVMIKGICYGDVNGSYIPQ